MKQVRLLVSGPKVVGHDVFEAEETHFKSVTHFNAVYFLQVTCSYLTSEFLGHQRATDLLEKFESGLKELDRKRLLQISMDGPNVNWKFVRIYKEKYQMVRKFFG